MCYYTIINSKDEYYNSSIIHLKKTSNEDFFNYLFSLNIYIPKMPKQTKEPKKQLYQ